MQTSKGDNLVAGDILKNPNGKYQGIVALTDSSCAWLTVEADSPETVDMHTRKNLITENEVQFKKYELVLPEGGGNNE